MDRRSRTAVVAATLGLTLAASLGGGVAVAQQFQTYQSPQAEQPPAQRNPGVPKGLTLVPWKLERREDAPDLPGVARRAPPPTQNNDPEQASPDS